LEKKENLMEYNQVWDRKKRGSRKVARRKRKF